jgi:hypothetical protein
MTARATATAACLPGAWTVTAVMTWPAVYALATLADRRHAARSAAAAKLTRVRKPAAVARNGDRDVVTAGWFVHAWHHKPGI